MSYLTRYLNRSLNSIKGTRSLISNAVEWVDHTWQNSFIMDFYYKLRWVFSNLWLIKHIWNFRTYSANFSVDLFCDSLLQQAHGNRVGWSINSEKDYRRSMFIAESIRKAFTEDTLSDDKSYTQLVNTNPTKMVTERIHANGMSEVSVKTQYKKGEQYYRKMRDIIEKRVEKLEQQRRIDAMNLFIKYYYKIGD